LSAPDTDLNIAASGALLLARWWARPLVPVIAAWPDAAEVDAAISPHLSGGLPVPSCSTDEADAMLTEYERLFVGPGPVPCPPYESYWRTDVLPYQRHALMGPCVDDLMQQYRALGIVIDQAKELPDHVAVEFEALGFALSLPDGQDVAKQLTEAHLDVWIPQWCTAVVETSKNRFYKELAALTAQWLRHIPAVTAKD